MDHWLCLARSVADRKELPTTKLECLAIVWATAKLCPYLMLNKFDIYTDHYAQQWLKSIRIGSALLHHWSVALEEFDFMIHHRPGKAQNHVDGLSWLLIKQAPPDGEEATLMVQPLADEGTAQQAAQKLHSATHVGGDTFWKLFWDSFMYSGTKEFVMRSPNLSSSAKLALITVSRGNLQAPLCQMGHGTLCPLTQWSLSRPIGGWSTSYSWIASPSILF